jgi:hypothetical protein
MTETNFEFNIASDVDFEDLIADIGFEDSLVALLTQEEGFQNLRIRIYPPKNTEFWDFRLDEFEDIILRAKKRLWELRKAPDG